MQAAASANAARERKVYKNLREIENGDASSTMFLAVFSHCSCSRLCLLLWVTLLTSFYMLRGIYQVARPTCRPRTWHSLF